MTKSIKWLLFVFLLHVLFITDARAQNIFPAASCSYVDVAAAIATATAAGSGNTVTIPAGTCTWTTPLSVTLTGSLSIIGAGSQSVIGGADVTIIIDNVNHSLFDSTVSIVTGGPSTFFRWSGITIESNGNSTTSNNGVFVLSGSSQNIRVDHSHFYKNKQLQVSTYNQVYGVFDHDLFDNSDLGIRMSGAGWGGGDQWGDSSWSDSTTFGSNRFIFVENSIFNNSPTPANDCVSGGRYVFRYNTFNGNALQTHPTGHAGEDRGCRAWEIYNNTFTGSNSSPEFNAMFASSGTGLMWGNTSPSGYETFLSLHSMRKDNGTYSQTPPPNGYGYCGTSFDGTGSNWDQNTNSSSGYHCLDQPGSGKGDLIQGSFPTRCDATAGCATHNGTWPNDALEPIYEWLNRWTAAPGYSYGLITNDNSTVLAANRDYYAYTLTWNGLTFTGTPFNGTVGTGSGPLSARPSTCTINVAYWATDANSLYQCSSTNSWTLYYSPYTYPHPLTVSSGGTPAPPTNLTATVQ